MKKILAGLLLTGIVMYPFSVNASERNSDSEIYLINRNQISISEDEYDNLTNLGFTEAEITNMSDEVYNENKNLNGEVISSAIQYYKSVTLYDRDYNVIAINDIEVGAEEFNNSSDSVASTRGITVGYIETAYKQMLTTITAVNSKYRYKVTLTWKTFPSVRSYDIIGIGIDTTVSVDSSVYFQQDYCYTTGSCGSSVVGTIKKTSTGGSVTFKLPSAAVTSLSSTLYFSVAKNTTSKLTTLKAYGDYAHATSTITSANAQNYAINKAGIVLNSSISSYYDAINTATAVWTGSW